MTLLVSKFLHENVLSLWVSSITNGPVNNGFHLDEVPVLTCSCLCRTKSPIMNCLFIAFLFLNVVLDASFSFLCLS
jgi:hypothetical protein